MQINYATSRIRLRPFKDLGEAEAVMLLLGVIDFGHWLPEHWAPGALKSFFEADGMLGHDGPNFMCLERIEDGAPLGYMYIELPCAGQLSAEIGTMLLPDYHGQRYGVDAKQLALCLLFENYMLERVFAKTLESNVSALRSMERSGLARRGAWRAFGQRRGRNLDAPVYDILRADWEQASYRQAIQRGADYD
jgi:RimJ/RimL family protein N-acetyltransferase